jgi:uncharacterized protein YcbX
VHVAELWRYPVKSLRGERLQEVELRSDGIPHDRSFLVIDGDGRLVTGRTQRDLLGLAASVAPDGAVLIDGAEIDDGDTFAALESAVGRGARVLAAQDGHAFDDTPLLVATDGAISHIGLDGRRFRPNIVIADVPGLAERDWPGRTLRIGEAEIEVEKLCERCVMTTIDPDSLIVDPDVLRRINEEYDKRFALNCFVARPGVIRMGDRVELV